MTLEATLLAADSAELMAELANMHLQLSVIVAETETYLPSLKSSLK